MFLKKKMFKKVTKFSRKAEIREIFPLLIETEMSLEKIKKM